MATTFQNFSDILPDPVNKINAAGVEDPSNGQTGPGFARVSFKSNTSTQVSKTVSGRTVGASSGSHSWEFSIDYNPVTRDELEPVLSFLESRQGRLKPFYVILPQFKQPRNATFAGYCASNTITAQSTSAGSSTLMINVGATSGVAGNPSFGDYLNIVDPEDYNHQKTYKVIRVETNGYYQQGTAQPGTNQRRIHLSPALTRDVSSSATVRFTNPRFRVLKNSDSLEEEVDSNGLYKFSLSVMESVS